MKREQMDTTGDNFCQSLCPVMRMSKTFRFHIRSRDNAHIGEVMLEWLLVSEVMAGIEGFFSSIWQHFDTIRGCMIPWRGDVGEAAGVESHGRNLGFLLYLRALRYHKALNEWIHFSVVILMALMLISHNILLIYFLFEEHFFFSCGWVQPQALTLV